MTEERQGPTLIRCPSSTGVHLDFPLKEMTKQTLLEAYFVQFVAVSYCFYRGNVYCNNEWKKPKKNSGLSGIRALHISITCRVSCEIAVLRLDEYKWMSIYEVIIFHVSPRFIFVWLVHRRKPSGIFGGLRLSVENPWNASDHLRKPSCCFWDAS